MSTPLPDAPGSLSVEELATQAEIPVDFVRRLTGLDALEPEVGDAYGSADVGRVRILHAWEEAGLSAEDIMMLVKEGHLAISWLNAPVMTRIGRLDVTFEELCSDAGVPLDVVRSLYEPSGSHRPNPRATPRTETPSSWSSSRRSSPRALGRADAAPAPRLRRQPASDHEGGGRTVRIRDRGTPATLGSKRARAARFSGRDSAAASSSNSSVPSSTSTTDTASTPGSSTRSTMRRSRSSVPASSRRWRSLRPSASST